MQKRRKRQVQLKRLLRRKFNVFVEHNSFTIKELQTLTQNAKPFSLKVSCK